MGHPLTSVYSVAADSIKGATTLTVATDATCTPLGSITAHHCADLACDNINKPKIYNIIPPSPTPTPPQPTTHKFRLVDAATGLRSLTTPVDLIITSPPYHLASRVLGTLGQEPNVAGLL